MHLKVINGTPRAGDDSLCLSCSNTKQRHGVRFNESYYGCEEFSGRIAQPVTRCTAYHDARLRFPHEAGRQAFRFVPSLGRFLSPEEWAYAQTKGKLTQADQPHV